MNLNPRGRYIYLLDNNFFASKNWKENIKHLQSYKQKVQFEGIDIRILTDEMCRELNKIKPINQCYHLAWDNPKYNILPQLKIITKIIKPYKLMFYILIGFNSTLEEDMYRVLKLNEYGCIPFVMPYNKKNKYQKSFTRWVNHRSTFKTVKWSDYKYK